MNNIPMYICFIAMASVWVLLFYKNIGWIMDKFREKHTFEEAIKMFKQGSTIKRAIMYTGTFKSRTVTIDGETTVEFGRLKSDGGFSDIVSFDKEDIFANDWIIEEKKEK